MVNGNCDIFVSTKAVLEVLSTKGETQTLVGSPDLHHAHVDFVSNNLKQNLLIWQRRWQCIAFALD